MSQSQTFEPGQVVVTTREQTVATLMGGRKRIREGARVTLREYGCFGQWFASYQGQTVQISDSTFRALVARTVWV